MRLPFLDLARCLAIVMMVLAHARDSLISPQGRLDGLARLHEHTRGYTAPLFFIVAGWAFAQATLPRWQAFREWGRPLAARLERVVLLFVWGRLLTLPWWHEGFPLDVPREVWLPFATSGVLECLAVTLLVTHGLLLVVPPRWLAAALAALAASAVLGAPWLQGVAAGWPMLARGVFNAEGVAGGFPLAPTAAFFWLGAALGAVAVRRAWSARTCAAAAGVLGAGFLAASRVLSSSPFLDRSGWVLLILAVLAAAAPRSLPLEPFAGRALTFYVGHMLMLWGVPFVPGLVFRVQNGFGVLEVVLVTCLMLAALAAVCLASEWARQRHQTRRAAEG